jgi:hypothetical protein
MKSVPCFEDFFDKSFADFLFSIRSCYYHNREKFKQKATRYRVFLQRKYLDSIRELTELFSR